MDIQLHNSEKTISVSDSAFAREFNETLVHQMVVGYMAAARAGTKAQKTRSDVSGGGAKPFRQKGTGRARAGTIRSPLWRTGGVTFAASPRDFSKKLNKKMYRAGLASIFSELLRQDRLKVVEAIEVAEAKTKNMVALLKTLGVERALLLTDGLDEKLYLAARNLPHVDVVDAAIVNPVALVGSDCVIATEAAVRKIEERMA